MPCGCIIDSAVNLAGRLDYKAFALARPHHDNERVSRINSLTYKKVALETLRTRAFLRPSLSYLGCLWRRWQQRRYRSFATSCCC